MKNIGIIGLIVVLLLFGAPLLSIKDDYGHMEYEQIGTVMLDNIDPYINSLQIASKTGEKLTEMGEEVIDTISTLSEIAMKIQEWQDKALSAIVDFVKGIFEEKTGQTCTGDVGSGFTCGTSEGGGGGSFGGGSR